MKDLKKILATALMLGVLSVSALATPASEWDGQKNPPPPKNDKKVPKVEKKDPPPPPRNDNKPKP